MRHIEAKGLPKHVRWIDRDQLASLLMNDMFGKVKNVVDAIVCLGLLLERELESQQPPSSSTDKDDETNQ